MSETGTAIAMATAQFQRGEPAAAAELLGPVLAAEPDHLRALVLMTHAQLALKRTDLALAAADHAVRVAPESAEALGALSRVLTALDRHDEAIGVAVAALQREPENAYRHNRLAWALLGHGGRGAEAEQAARVAVHLDPEEADFRITYAMVMKQLDMADRARQALRDALALEPDNAVAQHELATLDVSGRNPFALGRLARGVSGLAGALRTDPRQQASRFMLDVALRRFLVYTAILLAVLAYVGWRVSGFSVVGARVVAGVAALAPIAFATYFVVRLDRSLRAYLKEVVTQGRQRVAAIGAAVCLALLLTATAAPTAWLPWLLGSAAVGGFAVRLLTVSASNAHVRSAGLAVPRDRLSVILWWVVVLCLIAAIGFEIAATQDRWWLSLVVVALVLVIVVCLFVIVRRLRARRRAK
ncbi:tetratricopeptide repeat protein [Actinoplanes sp. NPDC051411]|uniref:tetratricopeptide repeat protein n=1 Tax=Actinoplanes sp. NPDC051411 TaxID=3155522 RepID=UPI003418C04D